MRPQYCGIGVGLLLLVLVWSGCQSTPSAYDESPAPLQESAPTAREMEASLSPSGQEALPAVSNGHHAEGSSREVVARAIPPVRKHPSPIVDEALTMSTAELHGSAFPGVAEVESEGRHQRIIINDDQSIEKAPLPVYPEEAASRPEVAPAPAPAPPVSPPASEELLAPPAPQAASAEPPLPAPALTTFEYGEYRIGAGDMLEFQSFDDESINREITVRYDGHISLPLIEDLMVADKTRDEAERMVREAYAKVFRKPQLSLIVRETGSKTFTVMGDVADAGRYPYQNKTRLIDAISMAGGLRDRSTSSSVGGFVGITGQLTKAFVIRRINGHREVLEYDLRSLGAPGAHSSEAPIYYGDIVYVPEGVNLVYVLGESRNPVIIELTEGMTLLQLLALSGGFEASTARLRSVVLLRQRDNERTEVLSMNVRRMLKTGEDFPLNPGDTVYIPRKHMVRIEEFVSRFTNTVSPVLNLYSDAVNAYYAKDLVDVVLDRDGQLKTLEWLNNIEQFGASTQNIVDLFGRP